MKILKKAAKWIGIVILVLISVGFVLYLVYLRPVMQNMKVTTVIKYDNDLTIIQGGGGNTGILASDSLVIVVDSKMDDAAENLYNTVKEIAGNKPILVINTHFHPDHSQGNKFYKGASILAGGNYTKDEWIKEAGEETLPTTWLKGIMHIKMGNDTVTIFDLGRTIHTSSDVFVYLHKRKMLFGGDVILNKQIPFISAPADPDNYLLAFDLLPVLYDIQKVVPGHGPMGGPEVIDSFRKYFNDMKTASGNGAQEDKLVAPYKDWVQVPVLMSPEATIKAFKRKVK